MPIPDLTSIVMATDSSNSQSLSWRQSLYYLFSLAAFGFAVVGLADVALYYFSGHGLFPCQLTVAVEALSKQLGEKQKALAVVESRAVSLAEALDFFESHRDLLVEASQLNEAAANASDAHFFLLKEFSDSARSALGGEDFLRRRHESNAAERQALLAEIGSLEKSLSAFNTLACAIPKQP